MTTPILLSAQVAKSLGPLRGIFFDIDDTLTTEGKLTAPAFSALWKAKESGLIVVAVTGRPAGWVDHIARMWPVDGVVGENGALYMRHVNGKMTREYVNGAEDRRIGRAKLDLIRDEILRTIPGTAVASDQAYREADLAIDFCEDVTALPRSDVDRIVAVFSKHGATSKVSSIHVNGWFGNYNKLGMLKQFMRAEFNTDLDHVTTRSQFVYVGDSPNDEPMFEFFPVSVGVANISDFEGRWRTPPRYRTQARAGEGFAELVHLVLNARAG